jgi:hypothetical protein
MPGLRILCGVVASLCLFSGCASTIHAPRDRTIVDELTDEQLLPTLQLDGDLIKPLRPSNDRDWTPDQARTPTAELDGDRLTIHNMRNVTYRTLDDYDVEYYDKTFDLSELTSVHFIVVPFNDMPSLGHTMLSFGFNDRDYLGVSVEIRKERGESYGPLKGFLRQYELIYIVGSERDILQRRVLYDLSDVYVYRTVASPAAGRALLVDVMKRANKLSREPEFYNTLTNNCTTNIRNHINHLAPEKVPYNYEVLLPGDSDKLAYDLGLLKSEGDFERTKSKSRVNYLAYLYRDDPDFSVKIRQ